MISTGIELGESSASRQSLATLPGRSGQKSIHGILKFVTAAFHTMSFSAGSPGISACSAIRRNARRFSQTAGDGYIATRICRRRPGWAVHRGRVCEQRLFRAGRQGDPVRTCATLPRAFCQQGDGRRRFDREPATTPDGANKMLANQSYLGIGPSSFDFLSAFRIPQPRRAFNRVNGLHCQRFAVCRKPLEQRPDIARDPLKGTACRTRLTQCLNISLATEAPSSKGVADITVCASGSQLVGRGWLSLDRRR